MNFAVRIRDEIFEMDEVIEACEIRASGKSLDPLLREAVNGRLEFRVTSTGR